MRKTWSFVFMGKEPFTLQVGVNRPIDHNGGMSLHSLNLSEEEREFLEKWLKENGQTYQAVSTDITEEEKQVQRAERNPKNNFFHCSQCSTCTWFDMASPNRCRAMDLPHLAIARILQDEYSLQAIAYKACPVIKGMLK